MQEPTFDQEMGQRMWIDFGPRNHQILSQMGLSWEQIFETFPEVTRVGELVEIQILVHRAYHKGLGRVPEGPIFVSELAQQIKCREDLLQKFHDQALAQGVEDRPRMVYIVFRHLGNRLPGWEVFAATDRPEAALKIPHNHMEFCWKIEAHIVRDR